MLETLNQNDSNDSVEPVAKFNSDFINRKRELILKDYESLFIVFGRETDIIYSFRGWTITILTIYFTFLFTVQPTGFVVIYLPGLCTILTFYLLEVSERSILRFLLQDIRELETIFMIEDNDEFMQAVALYEFRDLRDAKRPFKSKVINFFKSMTSMKIVFWNVFLLLIYVIITFYFENSYFADKEQSKTTVPGHTIDSLKKN